MNILSTTTFCAERQPNGDVWIRSGYWRQEKITIPKEDCAEPARLLMRPIIPNPEKPEAEILCTDSAAMDLKLKETGWTQKVDYTRCINEPE